MTSMSWCAITVNRTVLLPGQPCTKNRIVPRPLLDRNARCKMRALRLRHLDRVALYQSHRFKNNHESRAERLICSPTSITLQASEFQIPRRCPLAILLYVDDDSRRLQVLPARLELLGYEVLTAGNGASALEIFKNRGVDLAIVDYYMPEMGGDLVALEMKRARPEVPVIIFSGTFTMRELVIAFVDAFISTADGTESLIHKIAEVLGRRRLRRSRKGGQARTSAA